jgi:hypothetical protein
LQILVAIQNLRQPSKTYASQSPITVDRSLHSCGPY